MGPQEKVRSQPEKETSSAKDGVMVKVMRKRRERCIGDCDSVRVRWHLVNGTHTQMEYKVNWFLEGGHWITGCLCLTMVYGVQYILFLGWGGSIQLRIMVGYEFENY